MSDAFIYDHVRTPRGRGKVDGALHEVTALNLATQALAAVKERNKLDPALVDDVVFGCVDPVGEAAISRAWRRSRQAMAMACRVSKSTAFVPRDSTRSILPQPRSCRGSTI
jgi:acetyl-CoA acetyltransferase